MRDVKNLSRHPLKDVLIGVPTQRALSGSVRKCLPKQVILAPLSGTAWSLLATSQVERSPERLTDTRAPLNQRLTASTARFSPATSELSVPVGPNDAVGMLGFL